MLVIIKFKLRMLTEQFGLHALPVALKLPKKYYSFSWFVRTGLAIELHFPSLSEGAQENKTHKALIKHLMCIILLHKL